MAGTAGGLLFLVRSKCRFSSYTFDGSCDDIIKELSSICFSDARNQTFLQVSSAFVLLKNLKAQAKFRPTNQA
jgi:hypothetical protein